MCSRSSKGFPAAKEILQESGTQAMDWQEEAARRIAELQGLGFFDQLPADQYATLLAHVAGDLQDEEGDVPAAQLLAYDEHSLLAFDADSIHEQGDYVRLLLEFSVLMGDDFVPLMCDDALHPARMRAEVSFVWRGQRHCIPLAYMGDWVDVGGLLTGLNAVLARGGSERRLYLLEANSEQANIVYMLKELHDRAVQNNILQFEELDEPSEPPTSTTNVLAKHRAN